METVLSLPFTVDAYGGVVSSTDQTKIWSDRVRAVIGTNLKERLMSPEFGTLVPASFMENTDDATVAIKSEVERGFLKFLQLLKLQTVDVSFDEYASSLNISIVYDLPNNEQATTTVNLVSVVGNNPIYQENL